MPNAGLCKQAKKAMRKLAKDETIIWNWSIAWGWIPLKVICMIDETEWTKRLDGPEHIGKKPNDEMIPKVTF